MTEKEKNILIKFLQDTKDVFAKNKIQFWLDSGTLLGAIRDGNLIPWDKDIDLGCWKSKNDYQVKQKLKKEFENLGYKVFCNDHYLNIHLEDFTEINCDTNFYTIENGFAISPSSSIDPYLKKYSVNFIHQLIGYLFNKELYRKKFRIPLIILFTPIYYIFKILPNNQKNSIINLLIKLRRNISKHKFEAVPIEYFSELSEKEVFNGRYLIPQESMKYLEYRYGKEWNIPIKDWDTLSQDGTVAQF